MTPASAPSAGHASWAPTSRPGRDRRERASRERIISNRRRYERLDVRREFGSIDEFVTEYATNGSSGGVFIRSKQPLPVGALVNLSFMLLLDDIEVLRESARSSDCPLSRATQAWA